MRNAEWEVIIYEETKIANHENREASLKSLSILYQLLERILQSWEYENLIVKLCLGAFGSVVRVVSTHYPETDTPETDTPRSACPEVW